MAIRFFCSTCGQKFEVADSMAGRNAQCPHCRGITEIPSPRPVARAVTAAPSSSLTEQVAAYLQQQNPAQEPAQQPVQQRQESDEQQQPVQQPAQQQPSQPKPGAPNPTESKTTAPKPAALMPGAPNPTTTKPAASQPAVSQPAVSQPAAPKPAAPKPAASKPAERVAAKAVEPSPKPARPAAPVKPAQPAPAALPAPDDDIYVLVDELVDDPPVAAQSAARSASHANTSARAPSEPASAAWPPQPQAAPVKVEDDYELAPIDDDLPAARPAPQPQIVSSRPVSSGSVVRGVTAPVQSKAIAPPDNDDLSDLLSAEPVVPLAGGLAATGGLTMTDDFATAELEAAPNPLGFFADELTPVARGTLPEPSGPRCPGCGAALTTDSNICLDCGLDFRTGKRLRKPSAAGAARPRKRTTGSMTIVRVGLYLMFFAQILFVLGCGLAMIPGLNILCLIPYSLAILLATLASILCVFVPIRSGAWPPIFAKIAIDVSIVVVFIAAHDKQIDQHWTAAIPILMFVSVLCFIFFMKHLALYVDRKDIADDAISLIWLGLLIFFGGGFGVAILAGILAMIAPPAALIALAGYLLAWMALIFKFGLVAKDLAGAIRGR